MSRKLILIGALSLVLAPGTALSLGLGDIRLNSYLNQPMDAEISLSVASAPELETLKVELADQEAFRRHGLSRPAYFDELRFQVRRTGPSSAVIQVSSARPIVEPFLTFLVEARWSGGRVLREFTVLLDPPVFMPGPAAESAPAAAPAVESPRSEPAPRSAPEPEPAARPAPAPATTTAPAAQPRAGYGPEYGPVQRNETLWAIAQRVRTDESLTTTQVMMALFHANPDAFSGNVNRLRAGAILRVPSREEIQTASVGQANSEFRRQMEEWRGASAGPVERRLELAPPDEAARPTPPVSEPVRDPVATSGAAPELLDAVQELRGELADTRRMMELKDAEIASLQARLAELEGESAARPPAAEPGQEPEAAAPAPEPEAAEPEAAEPEPEAAPQPAVPPPSMVDRIFGVLGNIWLWLVVAVVLIVAALAVFLRKRQHEERSIEQDLAETGTWGTLEAPGAAAAAVPTRRGEGLESILVEEREAPRARKEAEARARPEAAPSAPPDLAHETEPRGEEDYQYPFEDTIAGETGINLDQTDPLAEADFHMAYGLYDQAAEIIKQAVEREPDRYDLRRKLIDICFVWGNAEEFLAQSKAIHGMKGSAEADDWSKIAIMGRQICPGEALFSGEGEAAVDVDFGGDLAEPGQPGEQAGEWLDFDVGESDEPLSALGDTREQPAPRTDRPIEQTGELNLEELGIDLDLGETGEHALQDLADRAPEFFDETGEFREGTARMSDLPDLPEPTDEDEGTSGGTMMMDASQMRRASEELTQRGEGWEQPEDEPTVTGLGGFEDDDEPVDSTQIRKFEAPDDEPTVSGEGGFEDAEEDEAGSTLIKKFSYTEEGPTTEVGGFEDEGEADADLDLDQLTQALKADLEDSASLGDDELTQMAPGVETGPQEELGDSGTREQPPSEMNEIGTKLDLARAYVDMGDPDGARSILEEVLEEGDPGQKEEARQLLDSLA
jgi:pilus assembly protein FimV